MKNDAHDDTADRPISINNWFNSDATFFTSAAPAPTATAATSIVPDAHIPPSGQKQHTKPFSPLKIKNIDKKYTIDTTPKPYTPTTAPNDASA